MNTQPTQEYEILKEKRKPKNPIKFKLQLNEEQKEAKSKILNNTITLLAGAAGSGKTLLACQIALEKLFMREVDKVIITRPTVSKEEIGFLPGDLREKMDPWVQPIYQNMFLLYDKDKVEKCINEGLIEIVPLSFMRGRTFVNNFVIVDEAQNLTLHELKMLVTRVGEGTQLVIDGDVAQTDIMRDTSGLSKLLTIARRHNINCAAVELGLDDIVRSGIVKEWLVAFHKEGGT